MANPGGGIGAKFVSVNLNKSYGQSSHPSHQHYNGAYGPAGTFGRARTAAGGGGGGGGGGMVVLSRSRTLQKAGPKLSVPPPLNLPSLRKEHEKFDLSGSTGGPVGGTRPGSGQRPTSSGVGWTKPVAIASQDKDGSGSDNQVEQSAHGVGGPENRVSNAYVPPSSRSSGPPVGVPGAVSSRTVPAPVEKTVVLRGEDFPSLQAAMPVSSGVGMKQKDNVNQKVKADISTDNQRSGFQIRSGVDMRPQEQSSSIISGNGSMERGEGRGLGSTHHADPSKKKEEYFPSPLPLFQLSPRSDWADDERDTGHGFADRTRDLGFSKSEHYWDRDFDIPRASILPHKPAPERRVARDDEAGRKIPGDVTRLDPYRRDARTPSREGRERNMWRSSPVHKDGLNSQEATPGRNANGARVNVLHKDFGKESKYVSQQNGDPSQDTVLIGNQESSYKTRSSVLEERPPWNHLKDSFNRGAEPSAREHLLKEQSSKYKGDSFQSNVSKSYFVSGGRVSTEIDSLWVSGREKGGGSKSGRSYLEDPFDSFAAFDEKDPFSGNLVGVIKRKKDVNKQSEFVDPVRESFEAELERVQKMQELERQRIMEEQEKALEQARRQEEERQRLIREDEERRRRMEEEAKEAAWRAEQEQQAAIRRAEEQRIFREEEKRRIFLEEERTKQAARQKLLELDARIAKRQAEAGKVDASDASNNVDEKLSAAVMINSVSASADTETWEDRERMVERRNASASFDPSISNRPLDVSSRSYSTRENPSAATDKGKPFHTWQRGGLDNGGNSSWQIQDPRSGLLSPRRDSFDGGAGYMPSRIHPRGFIQEPYAYEFGHQKDQRWNFPAESDSYSRNRDMDVEYQDYAVEKYGGVGWDQSRFRGNSQSYSEQQYTNYEADEPFPYGRSRYSLRQPRVLPPPSVASTQKFSFKASNGDPPQPEFLHSNEQYNSAGRSEPTIETGYYTGHQDGLEQSDLADMQRENTSFGNQELLKGTVRCDSQSSVSVSSPPNSPPHLSHDELDESGDSPFSAAAEVKQIMLPGNSSVVYNANSGQRIDMTASSCISGVDDDDWTVENNDVHQQDEYDEDGNGYKEEDEAREGDEENDLNQDFEDLELEEKGAIHNENNLVLGFDEGVEVEIPNDDFERDLSNQESGSPIPDSMHVVREVEMVGGVLGGEQSHEQLDDSLQATVIQETEKSIQDSAIQALSHSFVSFTTEDTGPSDKQAKSSAIEVPISFGPTTLMTTSSAHGQVDNSVKVQFGLFSGPSLIPSPVPAIQIGSIQMPLHLHPPVGPSLSHVQPSQPPIFQFGSIFQGVLPLPNQSLSFVQPNVTSVFSLNRDAGGTLSTQLTQDSSGRGVMKTDVSSLLVNDQPGFVSRVPDHHNGRAWESSSVAIQDRSADNIGRSQITSAQVSTVAEDKLTSESIARAEVGSRNDKVTNHHVPLSTHGLPDSQLQSTQTTGDSIHNDQNSSGFRTHGHFSGSRGKRFTYAVRNSNFRSTFPASDLPRPDASGFNRRPRRTVLRTEFRVRENVERRTPANSASSNNSHLDDKLMYNGKSNVAFSRSGWKRGTTSRQFKPMAVSESSLSGNSNTREIDTTNRMRKEIVKDAVTRGQNLFEHGEVNLKRNSREDFDAPLQSGVVRVFKQPGIEAPSDEDDFIEVRSKRQMHNDRREQREKEIKAKSRAEKLLPRKTRAVRSGFVESAYSKKVAGSLQGEFLQNVRSDVRSSDGRGLANKEGPSTSVSQPLAPIGTPAMKSEISFDKKSQVKPLEASSISAVSGGAKELDPIVKFEDKNTAIDNIPMPLKSWDPVRTSQQVMVLTQTQLEEAMKPPLSDTQITSVVSHSSVISEPLLLPSSILLKDRSFSSAASPINSLLAGEKIQFGAVTSPTLLPPSKRAPGSSRPDIHISHNLSMDEDECGIFFDKDKESDVSYIHLQDSEAEAEAAASAVAVAAISSDEVVGNGLGSSLSESKGFGVADIGAVTTGLRGDQKLANQSQAEEPLSVSLPADLSVETPPISLWPPLPSPQSSSGQLLSHFSGGQPSNFPFYEMNSMLGGQIFTFGPQEAAGSQSQPEKNSSTSSSGPPGTWQPQCPSPVDSFYGPPAGFAGPFISHPGGIPGVPGPPHMVVYNHFAPVAQFGQVGLSFMGPTFIPSGKPLDWKHNGPSPAIGVSDGHLNNANIGSVQRNPPNISPPMQHLAQGSPMMPMPSALAMFDVSPFQAQPDMSVQARWSHVPTSPLHAVPLWHSLQQQAEGLAPSQFGRTHASDQSVNISRFSEPQTPTSSDSAPSFDVTTEMDAGKLPDELGLMDSSNSTAAGTSAQSSLMGQSSSSTAVGGDAGKAENTRNGGSNNSEAHGGFKARASQQKNSSSQHGHPVNYNYQRGVGTSQRNNAGNDWSTNRRPSFHGRNQSFGAEKGYSTSKVKQVYVAKQTTSGT